MRVIPKPVDPNKRNEIPIGIGFRFMMPLPSHFSNIPKGKSIAVRNTKSRIEDGYGILTTPKIATARIAGVQTRKAHANIEIINAEASRAKFIRVVGFFILCYSMNLSAVPVDRIQVLEARELA